MPDGSRGIHSTYTIAVADTWEYFTWTFAGDASGTITNDTGIGFNVRFCLLGGSTYDSDTTETWSGSQFVCGTSQVNTMDNTANNFYLTGVQLEVGSVATSFAHEDYGTTLHKSRRYFERIGPDESSGEEIIGAGMAYGATSGLIVINYIEKRAIPTISVGDATKFQVQVTSGSHYTSAVSGSRISRDKSGLSLTFANTSGSADEAIFLRNKGGEALGYIDINSEI